MSLKTDSAGRAGTTRDTFKHAAVYSSSALLAKAIGFIMLPVYAHYLGSEGYGVIGMVEVVTSVMMMFIGFGIQGSMQRFYYEKPTDTEKHTFVSTSLFVMAIFVLAISTPVIMLNRPVARLAFGDSSMSMYVILASINFIFDTTSKSAETYILVRQKSLLFAVLAIVRLVVGLALNILLIVYLRLGVLGYFYSAVATSCLFSLITHGYAFSRAGFGFSVRDARTILRFSMPMIPGYIALFVRSNADRIILRSFMGLSALGAFEMLFKFAVLIGVLITEPFNKIWNVKRFEISNSPDGPGSIAQVFTYQVTILLFVGLVFSLEIPVLLRLLTPPGFWLAESLPVAGWIALGAVTSRVLQAIYFHTHFGILYAKRTHLLSVVHFATAGVSALVNLVAIKAFGIAGAVTAACLAALFQAGFSWVLSRRLYSIPFQWGKVALVSAWSLALFTVANSFSVGEGAIGHWFNTHLLPSVMDIMSYLGLDAVKSGKLTEMVEGGFPYVVTGAVRILTALVYLPGLVILGVLPASKLGFMLDLKSLRNPLRIPGSRAT